MAPIAVLSGEMNLRTVEWSIFFMPTDAAIVNVMHNRNEGDPRVDAKELWFSFAGRSHF
jgi:hypothetical protein